VKALPILSPVDTAKRAQLASAQGRYVEFLKRKKMLLTKERTALLEFLFNQKGHFSADELLYEMHRTGLKVSRATLYRTLSHFVEAGILSESDFGHGHTHYEIDLGSKPHVHLVSLENDEVKEVANPQLESVLKQLARKEGFTIRRYKIQVFGTFSGKRKT
jgi:Fur family ferric uptake transcriptional regulator